jgi:glycosylphosphatidylinositol phospholipase D
MHARQRLMLLLLGAALGGCGQDEPAPAALGQGNVVRGAVSKGPLQSATVNFFAVDIAGNPTGGPLVSPVTTDANGGFTVGGLPTTIPIVVQTSFGSYIDESDPETDPVLRRRISFGSTDSLEAVLPPGQTSLAITPYSMAMLKKARLQAAGSNFTNVYAAVGAQATAAFGFDPVLTIPADPTTGAGGSRPYAILLGAAALTINHIATSGTPEHLPGYADVIAFVDDFADGQLDTLPLAQAVRRFRNNNIGVYAGTAAPSVDEGALSQPATVPNAAPTINSTASTTATEDTLYTYNATVNDPDGPAPTWSLGAAHTCGGSIVPASGAFTFTPAGPVPPASCVVQVQVSDGGTPVTQSTTVTITAVNDPPVINSTPSTTATEDVLYTYGASVNDPDGPAPTWSLGASHTCGGSIVPASGAFTFTPAGPVPPVSCVVQVQVTDGGAPVTQNTAVTITAVNDAPSAGNDSIALAEGGTASTLVGGATSVLANDSDPESGPLSAVLVSGPANATTFLLNLDGTFTYLHNGSETTTDSFTYQANDGGVDSNVATVSLSISAVNDAPTAVDDTASTNEDVAVGISAATLAANDADPDGPSLNVTAVSNPVGGSVVLLSGTATFTPTPDFFGAGSFDYTLSDGTFTDTGSVAVTINPVNDAPSFTVPASAPAVSQDDPPQTVNGFATGISAGPANESGQTVSFNVTNNTNAALFSAGPAIDGAGTLSYTPAAGQSGSATITVVAVDNGGILNGGVDTSAAQSFTITVNVIVGNQPPVVVTNAGANVDEGAVTGIGPSVLLAQDPDNSPDELTYNIGPGPTVGFLQFMGVPVPIFSFTQADIDNGFISYQHDGSDTVSDSFDFAVTDTGAPPMSSAVETFTITVNAVNDAPSVSLPVLPVAMNQATAIEPIAVIDVDAGAADVSLTLSVLPVGTLTVKTLATGGVIPDAQVSGNGTDTVVVTATIAELSTTFGAGNDGLLLDVGAAGTRYTGPVTINADIDDLGNTGSGGAQTGNDFSVLDANHFELATINAGDATASTGVISGDGAGRSVASGGDFNGDGFDDYVIGAPQANGAAGSTYVVFGGPGGLPADVDLTTLDGSNGFRVDGATAGDRSGISVALNGDYTNDGLADLLIGSDGADRAHVIYGRSVAIPAVFSLGTSCTPSSPDLAVVGEGAGAQTGFAVAYAGDVNGDGSDDLLVGAPGAASGAGAAYVLFGFMPSDPLLFPPNVLVGPCGGTPSFDVTFLDGSFGFAVGGLGGSDRAGYAVAGGDINGDSIADIVVGAPTDPLAPTGPGRAFAVFGHTGTFPALVNLGSLSGSDGVELAGAAPGARAGIAVAVGDVNGDGRGEMIVGADRADPTLGGDEGAAYVVFGATGAFPASIDLTALDGSNGFVIAGAAAGDNAGAQVASTGDVNSDGLGDLLIGSPLADPAGRTDAGTVNVVYGTASGFGTILDLAFLDGINGFYVNGAAPGDMLASAGVAGDLNGDGFDEIHLGAPVQSGGAGRAYTVFGYDYRRLAASIGGSATAGAAGAILIGGSGSDTLDDGGFGGAVLKAGAGDDALLVTPLNPVLVDGGTGDDVLAASTGVLDLTVATGPGRYYRSEGLVLNGDAALRANALDVLRVSELDLLTVNGGTIAPQPVMSDDAWLREGFDDGSGIAHYRNGYARLEVFDSLNRDGVPVAFQWAASTIPGNGASSRPSLSGTGALMAFQSTADNLVGTPTVPPGVSQIYLRNLGFGGTTTLISQGGGTAGSADSTDPVITYDGRYIAFRTTAVEILGEVVPAPQVVLHDTVAGTFRLVSDGCGDSCEFDSTSGRISLSADGRYVTFIGRDSPGNTTQVWRMDVQTGTLVSPSVDGTERCGTPALPDACYAATMSADGRWIAWSTPNDTLANDSNGLSDVFLRDMQTGELRLVSATGGVSPPQASAQPWISADGRRLAFESDAALVGGDGNGGGDIYVYDITSQALVRGSTNAAGDEGPAGFAVNDAEDEEGMPVLSGDGRLLAFTSRQSALAPAVPSPSLSTFVKALDCSSCSVAADGDATGELLRGQLNRDANVFNADSVGFALSFDGRVLAMQSDADNVFTGDVNGARDVFAGLNPLYATDFTLDSDGDGLANFDEIGFTNPLLADTDGDGLTDGDEVNVHFTDPRFADTDSDGVADGIEVGVGSDAFTANAVVYVDPTAGCSAACDGTSWATAWPNEFNVEGSNAISGSDAASTVYVFFREFTGYGSLDLTSVDRKHVAYIGSMGPGIVKPAFPPTTTFSAGGSERALHIQQSMALVVANLRFENGFDSSIGGGALLEVPLNSEFGQNLVYLRNVEIANNVSAGGGGGAAASGSSNFLLIENSSITGNQAQGSAGPGQGGGVLALNGAQVSVTDSQLSGNSVGCSSAGCTALGGGAAASGAGATLLQLTDAIVENNSAFTGGGSLAAGGGLSVDSLATLEVHTSEIRSNTASGVSTSLGSGGGIAAVNASLLVDDSVIKANTASAQVVSPPLGGGGGVYGDGGAFVTLQRNIIADNKASAGPGGGVNLVDTAGVAIEDSKFLSNSALRPGGGLHVHPNGSTSVFNNLFVGNVSTDTTTDGGGLEVENLAGAPGVTINSNTVAWNQVINDTGQVGGGVSLAFGSLDFRNNIVWFNQNGSPGTVEAGDNMVFSSISVGGTGNNIDDTGMPGSTTTPPLFVQGFYLDTPSLSIDAGDTPFAGPLLNPPYTTDPAGAPDSTPLDIGFHYRGTSAGSFDGVIGEPPVTCGQHIIRPRFSNRPQGEPGHLIGVHPLTAVSLGSRTTIDPPGASDVIAWDRGDGTYAFAASGAGGPVDFEIRADDQSAVRIVTLNVPNGC